MYEEMFPNRLSMLRIQMGISARDMSLSLGQNPGYINNIETGKALPSMAMFFVICEYLKIAPTDFFDFESSDPKSLNSIEINLKKLTPRQLQNISEIIEDIVKRPK